jgi:hypothetical protein
MQQEWEQREWMDGIYSDIEAITSFINKFRKFCVFFPNGVDSTVHDRLADLNERLTSLGRTMVCILLYSNSLFEGPVGIQNAHIGGRLWRNMIAVLFFTLH